MEDTNMETVVKIQNTVVSLQSVTAQLAAIHLERQAHMANLAICVSVVSLACVSAALAIEQRRNEQLEVEKANLQTEVEELRQKNHDLRVENFWLRQDTNPYDWDSDSVWGSPSDS